MTNDSTKNFHIDMFYNFAKRCLIAIVLTSSWGGSIRHVLRPP